MIVDAQYISCPKCGWEPHNEDMWVCDMCRTRWNTFQTHGQCPGCGKQFIDTQCARSKGGCGQWSLNADWYKPVEDIKKKFTWFWQQKDDLPVSKPDRVWLESNLTKLINLLGPETILAGRTITPDQEYFQYQFTGIDQDVLRMMQVVQNAMGINAPDIKLMFFSQEPTQFAKGITATPSADLAGNWRPTENDLIKNEDGEFELWMDEIYLTNPVRLIASLSRLFSKYLLMTQHNVSKQIKETADLMSIALGFGIFRANAYFSFGHWTGVTHYGWRMSKQSGSSEQEIAYTMAWLAHYRGEDISWASQLNGTVKNYFNKCYAYIQQNPDKVSWPS